MQLELTATPESTPEPTPSSAATFRGLAYEVNSDGTTCTVTGAGTYTDTVLVFLGKVDSIGAYAFGSSPAISEIVYGGTGTKCPHILLQAYKKGATCNSQVAPFRIITN